MASTFRYKKIGKGERNKRKERQREVRAVWRLEAGEEMMRPGPGKTQRSSS